MKYQRGDVVIIDFPFASQPDSKLRPALVVQCDRNNQRLSKTLLVQITGRLHPLKEPTRLFIDPRLPEAAGSGLKQPSVISCENVLTVEQDSIFRKVGHLSDEFMKQVDECLKASFGISSP